MKYAITLYSKYTGRCVRLGFLFNTYEEAHAYAEKEVCNRCNRVEVGYAPDDIKEHLQNICRRNHNDKHRSTNHS